ncbi:MAG: isochorismatase family protein [Cellvibrio sp.]
MTIPAIPQYAMPTFQSLPKNKVDWNIDAEKAVLLIHDMQEYFLAFYGKDNPLVKTLIENIASLRQWAKRHHIPVVYTAQPTQQDPRNRALLNDMWGAGITAVDKKLSSIIQPIRPDADDIELVKWRYSAFQKTDLQKRMAEWNRDQLIIVGVYAHIGCMTTALDAFMRDIKPFFVADALADFSETEHKMAIDYVAGRCGKVVLTENFMTQTLKSAASDKNFLLSETGLRQHLAKQLNILPDELATDENLIDYGLDSIQVMELVATCEKLGRKISFEALAKNPTIKHWANLLSHDENTHAVA